MEKADVVPKHSKNGARALKKISWDTQKHGWTYRWSEDVKSDRQGKMFSDRTHMANVKWNPMNQATTPKQNRTHRKNCALLSHAKSLQSCLTLWDPMDCSPPRSPVHIFQARILNTTLYQRGRRCQDLKKEVAKYNLICTGICILCLSIDAFELWCWRRLLRVPLDCKEIQPVHPKGDQSWVFIGRTDAEAETPNTLATSCEELTHWKRP